MPRRKREITTAQFITFSGRDFAVLPRKDYEALLARARRAEAEDAEDIADHERAMAEYRAGRAEALTDEETGELLAAPTPLAFWRKRRGMTQQQLAVAAEIPQGYYSQLEAGKKRGAPDTLKRIAAALRVSLDELVA